MHSQRPKIAAAGVSGYIRGYPGKGTSGVITVEVHFPNATSAALRRIVESSIQLSMRFTIVLPTPTVIPTPRSHAVTAPSSQTRTKSTLGNILTSQPLKLLKESSWIKMLNTNHSFPQTHQAPFRILEGTR